ncbi:MaoC family dehydratase [Microbacterium sp. zg.B48]|uniref:MaoC family dehydratase n=1 Tax=Microbacterium sp. zg.B48 TaxID=2969408 RepID=UPI00214CCD5E|nr:MaoC family dehydratase [Microbacterium sp. zg.B48]MCR2763058.1 MaoC family dehydratase [Microbacterium sp. zg.B48]
MTESPHVFVTIDEVGDIAGATFGPSTWREIPQEDIDIYAQLSGDDNPIHVDAEAAAKSPFGGRIAHGMLTLSMVVPHLREIYRVSGTSTGIVYGFDKIRFPSPVPSGSPIRVRGEVADVTEISGGWQVKLALTFEVEGSAKPAVYAELILRHYR